ncbi:MAG: dihydropteroate synthase [Verrucomicrobiota bacterium]
MSGAFTVGEREYPLNRSYVMGIFNATPDSFSDGGAYSGLDESVERLLAMFDEGAMMVDIGGESTRPGYAGVELEEEIARVAPLVEGLISRKGDALISVDTSKAKVAEAALAAGARVVNDVWGFRKDEALADVAAGAGASCVLMHNARLGWEADSVLESIKHYWEKSVGLATGAGVSEDRILLDPGIGFGTTREEDFEMLRGLNELREFGFPMVLGASRKRLTGDPFGLDVDERLETTLATSVAGVVAGVEFFRVHDVKENARALRMADAIYRS